MEKIENINEVIQELQRKIESLTALYATSLYRIEKLETKVVSLQQRTFFNYDCN